VRALPAVILRVVARSLPLASHLGFLVLLSVLAFVALSAVGLVLTLYSFYEDLLPLKGGGFVVSSYSLSPLTSVISERPLLELLGNSTATQVEFIAFSIAYTSNRVVVVRGVSPEYLAEVLGVGPHVTRYCIYVGKGLAEKIGVEEGDVLVLHSPFTGDVLPALVCKVLPASGVLNYEILTSFTTARALRGIGEGYYSVAIVRGVAPGALGSANLPPAKRALLLLLQRGTTVNFEVVAEIPEAYVARFGIHREAVLLVAYSAVAVVALSCPLVGYSVSTSAVSCSRLLRQLGVSRRGVLTSLTILTGIYVAGAVASAYLALNYLSWPTRVEVLGYSISPKLSLPDVIVVAVVQLALTLLGVVRGFRELE
jgi:hypothetical protein